MLVPVDNQEAIQFCMPQGQQMCQQPPKIHCAAWPRNDPHRWIWLLAILVKAHHGPQSSKNHIDKLPLITVFSLPQQKLHERRM